MAAITRVMYILYGYIEGLGSYVTENFLYPLPTGKERILDIVPGGTQLAISGVPRGFWGDQNRPKFRRPYKTLPKSSRFVKTVKIC